MEIQNDLGIRFEVKPMSMSKLTIESPRFSRVITNNSSVIGRFHTLLLEIDPILMKTRKRSIVHIYKICQFWSKMVRKIPMIDRLNDFNNDLEMTLDDLKSIFEQNLDQFRAKNDD